MDHLIIYSYEVVFVAVVVVEYGDDDDAAFEILLTLDHCSILQKF